MKSVLATVASFNVVAADMKTPNPRDQDNVQVSYHRTAAGHLHCISLTSYSGPICNLRAATCSRLSKPAHVSVLSYAAVHCHYCMLLSLMDLTLLKFLWLYAIRRRQYFSTHLELQPQIQNTSRGSHAMSARPASRTQTTTKVQSV